MILHMRLFILFAFHVEIGKTLVSQLKTGLGPFLHRKTIRHYAKAQKKRDSPVSTLKYIGN